MSDTLVIASYNLHGFNQGRMGIDELISTYEPDVLLLQEHWLTPANLSKFDCYDHYCPFGSSAMSDVVSTDMLVGRPFGGVMTLVNNRLRPISSVIHCSDRFVIIKINNFMVINIYLPCSGTPNRIHLCESIFNEIHSFCEPFKDCKFVIGGDFNVNLDLSDSVVDAVYSFANMYDILRCDLSCGSMCDKPTYINDALQHSSTIDYILSSVKDVINYDIIDLNVNFSDHLPVITTFKCDLSVPISQYQTISNRPTVTHLRWDHANLAQFYDFTRVNFEPVWHLLNDIAVSHISNADNLINSVHDRIVNILTEGANLFVPKCQKNFLKYWWNQELDHLKSESIKYNDIWKEAGKPKHGQIFVKRSNSRLLYRKKIRECQRHEDQFYTNDLHAALMAKNGVQFWKCWRSKFDCKVKINGVDGQFCAQQIANNFQQHFSALSVANNRVTADNMRAEFERRITKYCGLPILTDEPFTTEMVSKIIDGLSKETWEQY